MADDIRSTFIGRHPVLANLVIIIVVALLGIWIVYLSIALFTKHGESQTVPGVENMSYTRAIETLHAQGLNVDIRDSLFRDDVKPGYVIEQFPRKGALVKPGRKVFLYINAVHPKEVVVDDNHNPAEYALRGVSYRQGLARLQELGFKKIRTVYVLGDNDRIVKITAGGVAVKQMQKVPVNADIVIEVSDGRLGAIRDSLNDLERLHEYINSESSTRPSPDDEYAPEPMPEQRPADPEPEGIEYF